MKKFAVAVFMTLVMFCSSAFAQEIGIYETAWQLEGDTYNGLLIIDNDGGGALRVLVYDRNDEITKVVDQRVRGESRSDGIVILGYEPKVVKGDGEYIADNFVLAKNGRKAVVDDAGNKAKLEMRQVGESEYREIAQKYMIEGDGESGNSGGNINIRKVRSGNSGGNINIR